MASTENIAPSVLKLVSREMQKLLTYPPEGILPVVNEDNVTDIQAWIGGPDSTPYEGGYFRVKVILGADFPAVPPKCYFLTKIYHPNISKTGEVCVNSLKRDWKKEHGIAHILLIVKGLLYQPNPESALNQEAAMALLSDHDGFIREAQLMTSIHAASVPSDVRKALSPNAGNTAKPGTTPAGDKSALTGTGESEAFAVPGATVNDEFGAEKKKLGDPSALAAKKRLADKKLEKAKNDKKRSIRRL